VLSFDPHPLRFFRRAPNPKLIYSIEDRVSLLNHVGIEHVLLQHFDEAFAALSPKDFVERVLIESLRAQHVVIGHDFAFGARRSGTVTDLFDLCARHSVSVEVIEAQLAPEHRGDDHKTRPLSSSWIRESLTDGHVKEAAQYLGRPYHLRGVVRRGHQRGRQLGFPTANLELSSEISPRPSVYAGWLSWGEGPKPAVISVGNNPTFHHDHKLIDQQPWSVEVHVLPYERTSGSELPTSSDKTPVNIASTQVSSASPTWLELYDLPVSLWFVDHIRDMISFQNIEDLKTQIKIDCDIARQRLDRSTIPVWPLI
jgi:riboflavin kinase/FMN adenylyltransferase